MRRAVLAVLLVCGCSAPTPPAMCRASTPDPPNRQVFDEGVPATAHLATSWVCRSPDQLMLDVAVLDPMGDVVPSEGALEIGADRLRASVTFTPVRTGVHELTARIEPGIALLHKSVVVVSARLLDAGAATPLAEELEQCMNLHLTPGGLAVCLDLGLVYEGDVLIQRVSFGAVSAMAAGVIWTTDGNRWVEGTQADGGRGFRGATGPPPFRIERLMGPTVDDVVAVNTNRDLARVRFVDGGLTADLLGNASGIEHPGSAVTGWWRLEDTIMAPEPGEMGCTELDAGVRFCRSAPLATAVEPAGIWYLGNAAISLARPEGVARLTVPVAIAPPVSRRGWNGAPVFKLGASTDDYVATWRNGIVLERLPGEAHSADAEWVFLKHPMRAIRR